MLKPRRSCVVKETRRHRKGQKDYTTERGIESDTDITVVTTNATIVTDALTHTATFQCK